MNKKVNLFGLFVVVTSLLSSCGTPAIPATEALAITQAPASPTFNNLVLILVVDNFTSIEENESDDGLCRLTADGQGLGRGQGSSMTILGQPHGLFVYGDLLHHIQTQQTGEGFSPNSLFTEGQGFDGTISLDSSIGAVRLDLYEHKKSDQALLVVAVDANGFNIDNIANNIPAAINFFASNNVSLGEFTLPATRKIVVNMSFVLIPCNPEKALGSSLGVDLTGLIDKLRAEFDQRGDFYEDVYSTPAIANLGVHFNDLYSDVRKGDDSDWRKGLPDITTDLYSDTNLREVQLQELNSAINNLNQLDQQVLIDNTVFQAYIVYLLYYDGSTEPPPYPDGLLSIYDPFSNPPLKNWTSQEGDFYSNLLNYPQAVFVGAAGNLGYPYPFAPASWDFVDSISSEANQLHEIATLSTGASLASYSNWGEIQMDGDFARNPKHIYGTSFAAPKFSYQIARYLLDGGSSPCGASPGIIPVLGYATVKIPAFTDAASTVISINNLAYDDAMATYCPASPPSCSISGDTPINVTFFNNTGSDVDVYWLDYSCNPVSYGTIPAGASVVQGTYVTHVWQFIDTATGASIKTYTAENDGDVVNIP